MRLPVPAPAKGSRSFDAVAIGLNAVDHVVVVPQFPEFNSKIELVSRALMFGGQAATAMVALARLGLRSRYIGRVGSDDEGRRQIESIEREGVDCSECLTVEGADTQTSFILIDEPSGERTVLWGRDDRIRVAPEEINPSVVTSARALHVDGHNIAAEVLAAGWARESSTPVTIDVDKDYGGESLYPLVDYLLASEEFPERMTGIRDQRASLQALQERYGNAVVAMTLGAKGVLALCDKQFVESPGYTVEVRDTTGAGDAFHGGFLYGLVSDMTLEDSLRVANAVAAMNCTAIGARGGLPTLAELEDFIRQAG